MSRRYWSLAVVFFIVFVLALVIGTPHAGRAQISAYRLYHPVFFKNYAAANSTLYLNNTSAYTANLVITLYGSGNTYNDVRMVTANGLLIVPASSLTTIPDGLYSVVVSADQALESVIRTQRLTGEDSLSIDRDSTTVATTHIFGPYLKGSISTGVMLFNPSGVTANVNAVFRNNDGSVAYSQNYVIPASGSVGITAIGISGLPAGFNGALYITADQAVTGFIQQVRTTPWYETEAYRSPDAPAVRVFLPRALKSMNEASGMRTTALFVANPNVSTATVTLYFVGTAGSTVYSPVYNVPAMSSVYVDLANVAQLTTGRYSVVMTSDQSVVFSSLTYFSDTPLHPTGDYESDTVSTTLRMPYVARTDGGHTVLSLQNVSPAAGSATISYFDMNGGLVYSQTVSGLIPGQSQRIDQSQLAGLPQGYLGYALVNGDQAMSAVVDEYLVPPCSPPTSTQIIQTPPGMIYTHTPVTFTATATGTLPFSYTWTIENTPLTVTTDSLTGVFIVPGHFTVGVTVTNACGADYADLPVDVQVRPPDLSMSQKLVSLSHIDAGDQLTYTLLLRNQNLITATASLTDPLPAHLQYIPDSVSASSGVITFTGTAVQWQGTIVAGTPVVVQYTAQVLGTGLVPGDYITNTAQLDDGLGNIMTLAAHSIYDPGYRLTINNGILYTNIPTVTLALSWGNEAPPITQMDISNDGGFGDGTGWIAASASYAPWTLTTYGSLQLARTVYVRFRDSNGVQYGPVQDDIIYDPIAPQITQITIEPLAVRSTPDRAVLVRVISADDNSGAAEIQLSHDADFATYQSFPTTGATTEIIWALQSSGLVYARVLDRAGNLSATAHATDEYDLFLPLISLSR